MSREERHAGRKANTRLIDQRRIALLCGLAASIMLVPGLTQANPDAAPGPESSSEQVPEPSSAQLPESSPAQIPKSSSAQLEEIVVTAQRRAENIQDTPVAVSAFSEEDLSQAGVSSIGELAHVDPSLNIQRASGVYLPFLRGVGNNAATSLGNESSVPVYIDDVYYTRLSSAYLGVNSIERVEVLKGPQGTLFGRNSSGGAIQMFTRDPGEAFEGDVTVGNANYNAISGQFYLSTPIFDTLSWNFAAAGSDQRDGWGVSETTGEDTYTEKSGTARSKLLWKPTDTTSLKLVGFYADQKGNIGFVQDRHAGTVGRTPGPPPGGVGYPSGEIYPNPPQPLPSRGDLGRFYDSLTNTTPYQTEEGRGGSLRIDQDVNFANFVSISAIRHAKGVGHYDADFSRYNYFVYHLQHFDRQLTQEFQLASNSASKIDWIVGAYYLRSIQGYGPGRVSGDALSGATLDILSKQVINSYALYTQATAPVADDTNITLGLRYTEDRVHGVGREELTIPGQEPTPFPAAAGGQDPYDKSFNFRKPTYKASIDHHFTDDVMSYASISRGYKSGTFNTVPLDSNPAKAEVVDAYEVGTKSDLFSRRLRLNGALFWNDVKNPQVLTLITKGNVQAVGLVNAEEARVRGAEVSMDTILAHGVKLRGAATYLDARFISFKQAPYYYPASGGGYDTPVIKPADGNHLPRVPKWRFGFGANYSVDTHAGNFSLDSSADFTDSFAWDADNLIREKPVTLVNASLNFTPVGKGNLTLGLWGKNLTDIQYYSISQPLTGSAGEIAGAAPPRTYGGSVSLKF